MKKSFMTRALATGLSLAMAFSLSAATNVTTAEAASLMKASSKTVTEGKTAKAYMTSSMAKKYRIKSHKESTVAKKYISVAMMSSRKGLKITAKEGALAAANLEKKGVNVKINFVKASSAKAAKKATKIAKTANLKVVVKAKKAEKLTMTAEATGVKTITVKFNKAIADASKVKVTVKKGTADRACKATVNTSDIVLAMDAKLIKGTYTVSVEGVDTAAMTADVVVEKDETLTSFKVSSVAAMARGNDGKAATNSAIIAFDALNQYGERMTVSDPQPSCTLGTAKVDKSATATASGRILITEMQPIMTVQGTKGTVILVDKNSGVNVNAEVTVSTASTPASVEITGVYDSNSNKIVDLMANDKLDGSKYILFTAKDQYGNDFADDKTFNQVTTISLVGGLTNIKLYSTVTPVTSRTVDGKEYLAMQLGGVTAAQGTYTLTIVNNEKGMLLNETYSVADAVVIKSVNITADKGLYANKGEQELSYEIIDQNGNSVTSYSVLNKANVFTVVNQSMTGQIRFVKNADGTAKLVYELDQAQADAINARFTDKDNDKESWPVTITVQANPNTSANLLIKTMTFNINEAKSAKSASKLKADTATIVASGKKLDIAWDKIVYADQYGNEMSAGDAGVDKETGVVDAKTAAPTNKQTSILIKAEDKMTYEMKSADKKIVFDASNSKTGYATVYVRYGEIATVNDYDFKFTVNATSTTAAEASTLKIDSVNDGNAVKAELNDEKTEYKADIDVEKIKVVAKIGGVDTVIPADQYVIKSTKDMSIKVEDYNKGTKSKTASVTIQVTTQDANGNRTETELTKTFQITAEGAKIAKVDGAKDADTTSGTAINAIFSADDLKAMFKYKDQFGEGIDFAEGVAGAGDVMISVDIYKLAAGTTADDCIIIGSGTKNTKVTFDKGGTYTLSVKAFMLDADGKETSAKDCKVSVTVTENGTTWTIL